MGKARLTAFGKALAETKAVNANSKSQWESWRSPFAYGFLSILRLRELNPG